MNVRASLRRVLLKRLGTKGNGIDLDDAVELCISEFGTVPEEGVLRDFLAAFLKLKGYDKSFWARVQASEKGRKYYVRRLRKAYPEYWKKEEDRPRGPEDYYKEFRCKCGAKAVGDLAIVGHAFEHEDPIRAGGRVIKDMASYLKLPAKRKVKVLEELIKRYYVQR